MCRPGSSGKSPCSVSESSSVSALTLPMCRHWTDSPTPCGSCQLSRALCRHLGIGDELATEAPEQIGPYRPAQSYTPPTRPLLTLYLWRYVPLKLADRLPRPPRRWLYDVVTSIPSVLISPEFDGRSETKPFDVSHNEPAASRWIKPQDGAIEVAVEWLIQFVMIASAPNPWIAFLRSMFQ